MIRLVDLVAELQRCWTAAAPTDVPTQFPGVRLDASDLMSWFEFWITQADEPPHRVPRRDAMTLMVDVHCFSRERDKRRVNALADAVRAALAHQTISVPASDSESPLTYVRIHESVCRDLTRESDAEPRLPLQHVVVSLMARAEQTVGA